jgi:serine phosphatase RsbU (regulator of sigma subunit)
VSRRSWLGAGTVRPYAREMKRAEGVRAIGSVLDAAEAASPVESVEAVTRELALALDATAVSFLIADLSGRALVRLAHVEAPSAGDDSSSKLLGDRRRRDAEESATVVPFDGGPEEQAVRTQTVRVLPPGRTRVEPEHSHEWRVLAPVTERGEVIGLLELFVADEPSTEAVDDIAQLAHVLAFVVIANRRHTDLYEWGQRTRPLSLSAEIQHGLLPGPQTCEAGAFTVAGWLEPAATIAGDTLDFSLGRDALHLSVTDAMGHGVAAALNAALCMGSLRNARNEGATLLEQVTLTNMALAEHAANRALEDFVTGLIGRLDLRSGTMELVNAGHVAPYLARQSEVTAILLPAELPLGLFPDTAYRGSRVGLEPGDRLVFVTDGMLERKAAGIDLPGAIADTRSLHPREAVRAMADRALEVTGRALADDATVLCLDWHGGHGRDRGSVYGAEPMRASRTPS